MAVQARKRQDEGVAQQAAQARADEEEAHEVARGQGEVGVEDRGEEAHDHHRRQEARLGVARRVPRLDICPRSGQAGRGAEGQSFRRDEARGRGGEWEAEEGARAEEEEGGAACHQEGEEVALCGVRVPGREAAPEPGLEARVEGADKAHDDADEDDEREGAGGGRGDGRHAREGVGRHACVC